MSHQKRVTINFSGEMLSALEDLAELESTNIPNTIRRSIGTEKFLRQAQKDGWRILIERGNTVREVILR